MNKDATKEKNVIKTESKCDAKQAGSPRAACVLEAAVFPWEEARSGSSFSSGEAGQEPWEARTTL